MPAATANFFIVSPPNVHVERMRSECRQPQEDLLDGGRPSWPRVIDCTSASHERMQSISSVIRHFLRDCQDQTREDDVTGAEGALEQHMVAHSKNTDDSRCCASRKRVGGDRQPCAERARAGVGGDARAGCRGRARRPATRSTRRPARCACGRPGPSSSRSPISAIRSTRRSSMRWSARRRRGAMACSSRATRVPTAPRSSATTSSRNRADGLLLFDGGIDARMLNGIQVHGGRLPLVVAYDEIPDPMVNSVATDNRAAARRATRYLFELGHRRIGHVIGHIPQRVPQRAARRLRGGDARRLASRSGPNGSFPGDYTMPTGIARASGSRRWPTGRPRCSSATTRWRSASSRPAARHGRRVPARRLGDGFRRHRHRRPLRPAAHHDAPAARAHRPPGDRGADRHPRGPERHAARRCGWSSPPSSWCAAARRRSDEAQSPEYRLGEVLALSIQAGSQRRLTSARRLEYALSAWPRSSADRAVAF